MFIRTFDADHVGSHRSSFDMTLLAVFDFLNGQLQLLDLIGGGPENIIHGAGDLYVTVFGGRTRKIGTLLGRGLTFEQAMEELKGVTLESIVIATRTARAVKKLAARGVVSLDDYPLLMHVDEIINNGAEVDIPWEKFTMVVEK